MTRPERARVVELRQVEDVADQPVEPHRLARNHVERRRAQLRVVRHTFTQRVDVAADRRQRRPQLVRHRHQEVPLLLLGLGEPRRHLAEAVGEMSDLVGAADARHVDLVAAARDVVGGAREVEHWPHEPP